MGCIVRLQTVPQGETFVKIYDRQRLEGAWYVNVEE